MTRQFFPSERSARAAGCPVLCSKELARCLPAFLRTFSLISIFAPYIYARETCPVAKDIASRVLTLPTYYGLQLKDVRSVAEAVLEIIQ